MRSSERLAWLGALLVAGAAGADPVEGFLVDRFTRATPGSHWLVVDSVNEDGPLAGAVAFTTGYASRPLVLQGAAGGVSVPLVQDQAVLDVVLVVSWQRLRLSFGLTAPLWLHGHDGSTQGFDYTGAHFDLGTNPDSLSDSRVTLDVRVWGDPTGPFRLGVSGTLVIPSGDRHDYITDATWRGLFRAQVAGDAGWFRWAGHLAVHLRPLDQGDVPVGAKGGELQWGLGVGAHLALPAGWDGHLGPELFGATALRDSFGATSTALELMLGVRATRTFGRSWLGLSLGAGGGLLQTFGAPVFRLLLSVEWGGRTGPVE